MMRIVWDISTQRRRRGLEKDSWSYQLIFIFYNFFEKNRDGVEKTRFAAGPLFFDNITGKDPLIRSEKTQFIHRVEKLSPKTVENFKINPESVALIPMFSLENCMWQTFETFIC